MVSAQPFSLRIFVADGDPDGLRLAERSNWIGKAVVFPRSLYSKIKERDEFARAGVYLLLGPSDDGNGTTLYIGQGEPVGERFKEHLSKKDFWTWAVCFGAGPGQLNSAHVQFLEARLIQMAKAAKQVKLDNAKDENDPGLSEADQADMQVFLDNMLGMLPVLNVHAFEQPSSATPAANKVALVCKGKGVSALGFQATQGFVVQAGSEAVGTAVPSMQQHIQGVFNLRQSLIDSGVLVLADDRYQFSQDYIFTSPSTAAAVVLGRSANGQIEWKTEEGKTLKELQSLTL